MRRCQVSRRGHVQTEGHVGDDRRLVKGIEHANVAYSDEAAAEARMLPGGIERINEQTRLHSREEAVHWLVVLRDEGLHEALVSVEVGLAEARQAVWADDDFGF